MSLEFILGFLGTVLASGAFATIVSRFLDRFSHTRDLEVFSTWHEEIALIEQAESIPRNHSETAIGIEQRVSLNDKISKRLVPSTAVADWLLITFGTLFMIFGFAALVAIFETSEFQGILQSIAEATIALVCISASVLAIVIGGGSITAHGQARAIILDALAPKDQKVPAPGNRYRSFVKSLDKPEDQKPTQLFGWISKITMRANVRYNVEYLVRSVYELKPTSET